MFLELGEEEEETAPAPTGGSPTESGQKGADKHPKKLFKVEMKKIGLDAGKRILKLRHEVKNWEYEIEMIY